MSDPLKASKELFNQQVQEILFAGTNIIINKSLPTQTIIESIGGGGDVAIASLNSNILTVNQVADNSFQLSTSQTIVNSLNLQNFNDTILFEGSIANNVLSLGVIVKKFFENIFLIETKNINAPVGTLINKILTIDNIVLISLAGREPHLISNPAIVFNANTILRTSVSSEYLFFNRFDYSIVFCGKISLDYNQNYTNLDQFFSLSGCDQKIYPLKLYVNENKKNTLTLDIGEKINFQIDSNDFVLVFCITEINSFLSNIQIFHNGTPILFEKLTLATLSHGISGELKVSGCDLLQEWRLYKLQIIKSKLSYDDVKYLTREAEQDYSLTLSPCDLLKIVEFDDFLIDGNNYISEAVNSFDSDYNLSQTSTLNAPMLENLSNINFVSSNRFLATQQLLVGQKCIRRPFSILFNFSFISKQTNLIENSVIFSIENETDDKILCICVDSNKNLIIKVKNLNGNILGISQSIDGLSDASVENELIFTFCEEEESNFKSKQSKVFLNKEMVLCEDLTFGCDAFEKLYINSSSAQDIGSVFVLNKFNIFNKLLSSVEINSF